MPHRLKSTRSTILLILILAIVTVPGFALDNDSVEGAPGKVKDWSLGYSFIHLKTLSGGNFDFHSLALNYYTRNQWRIPLISSTTLFIPAAVKDGDVFYTSLGDYYKYYLGMEFMLGLELGGRIGGEWRWRVSPGWNINGILMPGATGYYPFQSLTTGPALNLMMEKDWGRGLSFRFGFYGSYQMFDIIHTADKLKNGYTLQMLIGFSFKDGAAFGRVDYE